MPKLLIVDDDQLILQCFRYAFPADSFVIETASTVAEALSLCSQQTFDVVVTDIRLPDRSGLELLRRIQELDRRTPVILTTGHGTASSAIESTRNGAFAYLLKPLDLDQLQSIISRAVESSRIGRSPVRIDADDSSSTAELDHGDVLVGQSPAMQEVYRQIGRVSGLDVTVLILGETGTGKEVVARAIDQYSRRSDKPFLAINCAAIPEHLLESELFGHEKGAFTGADRQHIGKFEQCDGGTLFLDEIGDMPMLTQTKLLRVLQDQSFERVGGSESVHTDVRLIAATNRNLAGMMNQQTFRTDLFYRLNVYTIQLPPLRERIEDLPLLVRHFLSRFNLELKTDVQIVSLAAMSLLREYSWPGNLRELQSVLKHAMVETTSTVITPDVLPAFLRDPSALPAPEQADQDVATEGHLMQFVDRQIKAGATNLYSDVVQRIDRIILPPLLHHVDGNLSHAAAILGISRATLRAKLARIGISLDRSVRLTK